MPGKTGFHDDKKKVLVEPLDLTGPQCVSAHWSDGEFEARLDECPNKGAGLYPEGISGSQPVRLVLEAPCYQDFQEVKAPIVADARWKHAFAAKTRVGYRCLWLCEVSLAEALSGVQVAA